MCTPKKLQSQPAEMLVVTQGGHSAQLLTNGREFLNFPEAWGEDRGV